MVIMRQPECGRLIWGWRCVVGVDAAPARAVQVAQRAPASRQRVIACDLLLVGLDGCVRLASAVWIPLRAADTSEHVGSYGQVGYRDVFFGAGSTGFPADQREAAEKLGWSDIGISHSHGPWIKAQRAHEAAANARTEQARQAEQNRSALDTQRAQILAAVHSDSTDGLRAKVATLEAVQRNSPPDSESFRSATSALLVINEELAKRGALK